MSKHTEGPWEWANGTHALVGPKIDDKPVWLRPVVLRSETGVKAEDARLIAAAPALLEALQGLIREHDAVFAKRDDGAQDSYYNAHPGRAIAYRKARAAIAAATDQAGEQHG